MTEPQINEAVARKLGHADGKVHSKPIKLPLSQDTVTSVHTPDYCHSIEAAWEIVKHLCKIGHPPTIWVDDEGTACISFKYDQMVTDILPAPMAICMAFLKLP